MLWRVHPASVPLLSARGNRATKAILYRSFQSSSTNFDDHSQAAPNPLIIGASPTSVSAAITENARLDKELAEVDGLLDCLDSATQKGRTADPVAGDGENTVPWPVRCQSLSKENNPLYVKALQSAQVKVSGSIRSIRKQKHRSFVHLTDGSTLHPVQAVVPSELSAGLTNGCYAEFNGKWTSSPGAGQANELQVTKVRVHGPSDAETYAIQKKFQTNEFLRTVPHLRLRTPFHSLLARFRSSCLQDIQRFFLLEPSPTLFYQVHPPLITSSDCEGAGEVFSVSTQDRPFSSSLSRGSGRAKEKPFFTDPKYLTVSSQLHLEAYSAELGNVWSLSPTFRAEQSDTPRHLAEFYMLEAEMRDIESLEPVLDFVEDLIRTLVRRISSTEIGQEMVACYEGPHTPCDQPVDLRERWSRVIPSQTIDSRTVPRPWARISYADAMQGLVAAHDREPNRFSHRPNYFKGFQLEHEKWIVSDLANGHPVFVTNYPKSLKPFYMLPSDLSNTRNNSNNTTTANQTVANFDLLFPNNICEVAGGSLREHRLEHLIQNMREHELIKHLPEGSIGTGTTTSSSSSSSSSSSAQVINKQSQQQTAVSSTPPPPPYPYLEPGEDLGSLRWYADLRRYGSTPHGGFGLGFDRLLAYLAGVDNVRDVVPFPRVWGRADC